MKREGFVQRTQGYVALWLILGGIPLLILGGIADKMTNVGAQVATAGTKQQDDHAASIFEPGPLAEPKSLQQTGVFADTTRATIPSDNPQTPPKIALGQRLFFERRLSADETVACSSCHDPKKAFTDGRPVSIGIKGRVGQRNAPTILNALYNKTQFWDGRARTLEEQAAQPIVNPSEMGQPSLDKAVARIASVAEYDQAFRDVFGRPPNGPDLLRAIASYERTQVSFDSPFDHFVARDENAIDTSAKRGWAYSTVKTLLDRMVDKGLVGGRQIGNVWEYTASMPRNKAQRRAWRRFVDVAFGGALAPTLAFVAKESKLTKQERAELRSLLDQLEKGDE